MLDRPATPSQAEIDQAMKRGRQMRARAFVDVLSWLADALRRSARAAPTRARGRAHAAVPASRRPSRRRWGARSEAPSTKAAVANDARPRATIRPGPGRRGAPGGSQGS